MGMSPEALEMISAVANDRTSDVAVLGHRECVLMPLRRGA
jgi:hypothetical protein